MNYFLFQGSQSSLQQVLRWIFLDGEEKEIKKKLLKHLRDKKDDYKKFLNPDYKSLNNDDQMDDYIKNIEDNWSKVNLDVITAKAIYDLVGETEIWPNRPNENIEYPVWLFTPTFCIPVHSLSP